MKLIDKKYFYKSTGSTSISSKTARSSPARFSPSLNSYHWNNVSLFETSTFNILTLAVAENLPIRSGPSSP